MKRTELPSSRTLAILVGRVEEAAGKGIEKQAMARAIGVHPAAFSALLAGRRAWKLDYLDRLAEFLGLTVADLFHEAPAGPLKLRRMLCRIYSESTDTQAQRAVALTIETAYRLLFGAEEASEQPK